MSPTSDPVWRWCDITWSPRLRPASAALLSGSTLSMKMRKPFSEPPSRVKDKGASLEGLVRVTTRSLALAAHAMFNSLRCPHIFWFKERHYMSSFAIDSPINCLSWRSPINLRLYCTQLTSLSRLCSNSSRKCVIAESPSKSLKWLFTHSKTTRVTWWHITLLIIHLIEHWLT